MAKPDKTIWAWLLLFIFGPGLLTAALWIISEGHHLSFLPLFIYSCILVLIIFLVLWNRGPMEFMLYDYGYIYFIIGIFVLFIFGGKGLLWAIMALLIPILIPILLSIPFYFVSFLQWLGEDK